MKKCFIFAAVAAVCLMGMVSCGSEESFNEAAEQPRSEQEAEELALTQLQSNIAKLNAEEFGAHARDTRGLFSFFRRFWKIVTADAVGAIIGTGGGPLGMAVGAATASGCAAIPAVNDLITTSSQEDGNSKTVTAELITPRPYIGTIPDEDGRLTRGLHEPLRSLDSIGFYHNRAIVELNKNNSDWLKLSAEDLTKELGRSVINVTGWGSTSNLESFTKPGSQAVRLNAYLQELVESDIDVEEMCAKLKTKYPSKASQISVLCETIKGIDAASTQSGNTLQYCEKALDLVNKAGLNATLTSQIRSGIIVANASSILWNKDVLK